MRADKAIGVAVTVLGVAALAALWQVPSLMASGQQAGTQNQQVENPTVTKHVVSVTAKDGADPVVVTLRQQAGAKPKVMLHDGPSAQLAAMFAGGGPRLGVQIRDVGKEDLARLKLTVQNGVVIDEVMDGSAAQKAGVKAGDVVVQFDGEAVRSTQQFTRLVRETVAGRMVKMAVVRDGKRMDLDVAPAAADDDVSIFVDADQIRGDAERQLKDLQGRMPQYRFERRVPAPGLDPAPMPPGGGTFQWKQEAPQLLPRGDALQWFGGDAGGNFVFTMGRGRLGVTVQDLTPELATYFGVKDGLLVSAVQADSPAANAGIKAGDVISSVNGKSVAESGELVKELADKDGEVTIGLTRDKKPMSLKVMLESRKPPVRRTIVAGRPA